METEGNYQPARRVVMEIDGTTGRSYSDGRPSRSRRRRRKRLKRQADDATQNMGNQGNQPDDNPSIPLELWPAIREILGYGKKTHALGAVKAASALSNLASRLRELGPPTPALERIMLDAERESREIMSLLENAYGD